MFEINIINNKIQNLYNRIKILKNIFNYNNKKKRLKEINIKLNKYNIWNDSKQAQSLIKECSDIELIVKNIETLIQNLNNISNLVHLLIKTNDIENFNKIIMKLTQLEKKIKQLEFNHIFSGQYDYANCYLDLQAGSGGIDAQDWTNMLMRMYLRWSYSKGFKTDIIEISDGCVAGLKSATIQIIGDYAYGWLRTETGIHRLVRKSPFNSNSRRHTSFSSAFVYPKVNDNDINIKINFTDLRIDVYRASGAGGQHVNKTESAVRITHIPTGIVTQCQNNRSQHKNKDQALNQLRSKLYKLEIQKKNINKQELEKNKSDIGWGSQIRSYVLDDSRIKDLRTGVESRNTQAVLDGDLDKFIKKSLKSGL
ncbi:MAG: peptide chain release factor 2 [Arsenophonus endosymbiont of Ceratovacuna japonica]